LKYQSLQAFEKHLNEALPAHLSPIYMVGCPSVLERRKILAKVLSALLRLDPHIQVSRFDAAEIAIGPVMETLHTLSLFGNKTVVFLDNIEELKKADLESLSKYLNTPSKETYLLLGAGTLKNLSEFYLKGKKELILLDLTTEKPWEKEKRLKQELVQEALKANKKITPQAVDFLIQEVGTDAGRLEQEFFKLRNYVGDKALIELIDAQKICSSNLQHTGWEIADAVVWGKEKIPFSRTQDLSTLLGLLPQIRYQLQLGMKMAEAVERGASLQEIQTQFPTVRAQALEHHLFQVRRRKTVFFMKALNLLFEIELLAKNSSFSPSMIWDVFNAKLEYLTL